MLLLGSDVLLIGLQSVSKYKEEEEHGRTL